MPTWVLPQTSRLARSDSVPTAAGQYALASNTLDGNGSHAADSLPPGMQLVDRLRRTRFPGAISSYNPVHCIDDESGIDHEENENDAFGPGRAVRTLVFRSDRAPVVASRSGDARDSKNASDQDEYHAVLRSLVLPIFIPAFAQTICLSLSIPILPLFVFGDLGASTSDLGLVLAAQGTGRMLGNIPAGHYMSIVGDRAIICVGLFLNVVAGIGMGLSPNLGCLIVAEIFMGAGFACYFQARMSYLKEAVVVSMRGRAMALLGGVFRIGSVVGPFLGGLLAATCSIRVALLAQGAFALIALALTLRFLQLTLGDAITTQTKGGDGDFEMSPSLNSSVVVIQEQLLPPPTYLSVWREHWRVLTSVALYGCLLFIVRQARDILLPLVSSRCGLGAYGTGLVTSASYMADTATFYAAGVLMDAFGRKCNGFFSPVGFVVGFLMLSAVLRQQRAFNSESAVGAEGADNDDLGSSSGGTAVTTSLYVAGAVLGVASGLGSGLVMTLGSDLAPPDPAQRGLFLGLFRVFTDAGILLGSVLVGGVADGLSLGAACDVSAACSAVAAVQILAWVQETLPKARARQEVFMAAVKVRAAQFCLSGHASERPAGR